MHATEFQQKPPTEIAPVVVLAGGERALKLAVIEYLSRKLLGDEDLPTKFAGKDTPLKKVRDELLTVSMFGERRLVIVEEADDFVSEHRSDLEKYVDSPAKKSVLVLDVKSLPKNQKLYKLVDKAGLFVDCSELTGAALTKWIQSTVQQQYGKKMDGNASQLLVALAGSGLGQLEQELAKLASYVGDGPAIDAAAVQKLVGGWKAETTWAMTNAVRDGRPGDALVALASLLTSGESEHRLLGGISFVFRKFALATELSRQGLPLNAALQKAGVFPGDLDPGAKYLRRIGRPQAERIAGLLLQAEASLKGGSHLADRNVIELLLVELSGMTVGSESPLRV